jgi:hypothetical protein
VALRCCQRRRRRLESPRLLEEAIGRLSLVETTKIKLEVDDRRATACVVQEQMAMAPGAHARAMAVGWLCT